MKKQLTLLFAALCFLCNAAIAQLPAYLPADGLVAWYPFNGNANDESGNGNDGVVNGAVLSADRFNNLIQAYSFDGENDFILFPSGSTSVLNITGELTVSHWVKTTDESGIILSFGNFVSSPYPGYGTGLGTANTAPGSFVSSINGNNYSDNSVQIIDNQWHILTSTFEGDTISLFVDGILKNQLTNVPALLSNDEQRVIGCRFDLIMSSITNYGGLLDDIAIYNRALTESEIQNLYTSNNQTVDTGDGAAPLPQGISYQAAARDAQGQVIADAPVNVRFSLHEGGVDGAVAYSETHALTTNSIGLFNTVFGNGIPEQSAFDSINWAATTKFLQVEIDLGDGYVDMGTTQLLSVP